jgi:hypothetical protein
MKAAELDKSLDKTVALRGRCLIIGRQARLSKIFKTKNFDYNG